MTKVEKRIANFVMDHMLLIAFAVVTVLGVLIRLPLRNFVSGDARAYLLPWYEEIRANGIAEQVGNYNLPYQFAIYLMTKLPIKPLHAYKILSCALDFLLALVCALIAADFSRGVEKQYQPLLVYCAVLLSPVVVLNSAAWAQCDSIYVFFSMCGLYLLMKDRAGTAMFCFGLSLAFKLQAVFFFPALILIYLLKKSFSAGKFLMIPLAVIVLSLPMLLVGRSLLELFQVYIGQMQEYPEMVINYPSFYCLLTANDYAVFSKTAILFAVAGLGALFFYIAYQKVEMTKKNMLMLLFMTAYTCVLFLPAMHERYGYPYEILAWILVFLMPKTAPLCVGLQLLSLRTYCIFLFATVPDLTALAYVNLAIYLAYGYLLLKEMRNRSE